MLLCAKRCLCGAGPWPSVPTGLGPRWEAGLCLRNTLLRQKELACHRRCGGHPRLCLAPGQQPGTAMRKDSPWIQKGSHRSDCGTGCPRWSVTPIYKHRSFYPHMMEMMGAWIFCSSPWHLSADKSISTEERMLLSNSKSWDSDGDHLLEIKGTWRQRVCRGWAPPERQRTPPPESSDHQASSTSVTGVFVQGKPPGMAGLIPRESLSGQGVEGRADVLRHHGIWQCTVDRSPHLHLQDPGIKTRAEIRRLNM
ncbi:uncharacterized protein LOC116580551 isoform X2 [Mustela erminea]|uniref:uncharacterized protein LOC116580551 isoform X2 n=1 Tax=Mustela erminea TaxID=36723 RepID=UPI001387325E|nr:uncharacterized protein LOC116580551 isoform X2 [Mustela erminea]